MWSRRRFLGMGAGAGKRPFKRNLVDVFVSKPALTCALDTANELFQALEKRGHRVALALPR